MPLSWIMLVSWLKSIKFSLPHFAVLFQGMPNRLSWVVAITLLCSPLNQARNSKKSKPISMSSAQSSSPKTASISSPLLMIKLSGLGTLIISKALSSNFHKKAVPSSSPTKAKPSPLSSTKMTSKFGTSSQWPMKACLKATPIKSPLCTLA